MRSKGTVFRRAASRRPLTFNVSPQGIAMTLRRLSAYIIAITLPAYVFAGPYMSWRANEYYMIDGASVEPSSITPTPKVDSKLLDIRRLIISRSGEPDDVSRCYAHYAKSGNPTRVFCEEVVGANLSGAVWLLKGKNIFRCVSGCRPSVPKTIIRSLDG